MERDIPGGSDAISGVTTRILGFFRVRFAMVGSSYHEFGMRTTGPGEDRMDVEGMRATIAKQYEKCGGILADAIRDYGEDLWMDEERYFNPAWRVAYHAVFYTNIYCSPTEAAIEPWPGQQKLAERIGRRPPEELPAVEPYSKAQIVEYLQFVLDHVPGYLEEFDPGAPCWPHWYDENQLEFHFNNLRHLQHHTGELIERHDIVRPFEYGWR